MCTDSSSYSAKQINLKLPLTLILECKNLLSGASGTYIRVALNN